MDFGLFMMPLHPPRRAFADAYDRDIALIVQADRLGRHPGPDRLLSGDWNAASPQRRHHRLD